MRPQLRNAWTKYLRNRKVCKIGGKVLEIVMRRGGGAEAYRLQLEHYQAASADGGGRLIWGAVGLATNCFDGLGFPLDAIGT